MSRMRASAISHGGVDAQIGLATLKRSAARPLCPAGACRQSRNGYQLLVERGFRRSSRDAPTIDQEEQHEELARTASAIRGPAPAQDCIRCGKASRDERASKSSAEPASWRGFSLYAADREGTVGGLGRRRTQYYLACPGTWCLI